MYRPMESEREQKQMIFAARRKKAQRQYSENQEYLHKKKIFMVHKWEIIKQKKMEADA